MRQTEKVSLNGKVALPRVRGKALLTFAFCVVFSAALWLLQVFREVNTASFEVPLEYIIPNDLILLDSLPQKVTVQVKDKGWNLIHYLVMGSDGPLKLDCSPYCSDKNIFQMSSVNLEQILRVKFPTGEITVTHPQSIRSFYTKGTSKRVPVRLRLNTTFAKQKMQSGMTQITPQYVTVYASEEDLSRFTEIVADSMQLDMLSDTTTFTVQLPRLQGVKLVPDRVQVTVPVESYVEKHFTLKVEPLDVPVQFTLKTFPQEVSVVCFLPMSKYRDVGKEQFRVGVRYRSDKPLSELPVEFIRKPSIASVVKIKPEKVEILLEKNQ